jgi:hypothetical protein
VLVLVERGGLLEAMRDYRARVEDLVTIYRIRYTPEKADWGWTDADTELPDDALRVLAGCVPDLSAKSLRKHARVLAKAFEKESAALGKRLGTPLPKPLISAVMEIF